MASGSKRPIKACEREAEAGRVDAQYRLGLMYATGAGVPLDFIRAHKWLNLAAHHGDRSARALRSELAGDMSPDQIAEAQRLAREWMHRHPSLP